MSHRWCLLILAAAILVPGTTPEWLAPQIHPLEQTLKSIHSDYLGSAKVYRYPDPPGQSREELVHCYRMLHRGCGENQTGRKESADFMQGEPCDPDDDASPWSSQGGGYLPEDLSELFILPEGNVDNIDDPDIDLYIVNPMAVLSSRVFYCNGMNHSSRMAYWRDTISKSPAFNRDSDTDHVRWRHIFICVSWQCDKHLKFKDLKILTGYMTYLINEDNHNWAGSTKKAGLGVKYVVPYLPHRYITTNSRPKTGSITFIGSVRLSHVRQRVLTLQNISGTYIRQAGTGTYGYTGNHHTSQKAIDYANVMMNSTFCFALPGGTITARRVYDAILAGCIPVIVTGFDDTEKHNTTDVESQKYRKWETLRNLAFTDAIPWHDFSFFVDQQRWLRDAEGVVEQLQELKPHVIQQKQQHLAKWKAYFDYRESHGDMNQLLVRDLVALTTNDTRLAKHMHIKTRPDWAWRLLGYNQSFLDQKKAVAKAEKKLKRKRKKKKKQEKRKQQKADGTFVDKATKLAKKRAKKEKVRQRKHRKQQRQQQKLTEAIVKLNEAEEISAAVVPPSIASNLTNHGEISKVV